MGYISSKVKTVDELRGLCRKICLLVCSVIVLVGINVSDAQAAPGLNMTECTLFVGDGATLRVSGYKGMIKWKSSKETVAFVGDGSVHAKKAGKAVITAKCGKRTLKCRVTVLKPKKYSKKGNTLELDNGGIPTNVYVGDMYDFVHDDNGSHYIERRDEYIYDENGTQIKVWRTYANDVYNPSGQFELITWSSSDESVAHVTQEGLVFFNKPGYVVITAKTASRQAKVGFNVGSTLPTIAERKEMVDLVVKTLKKAGAKKVITGVADEKGEWTDFEQSVYAQIYGGRHLSKDDYLSYYSGCGAIVDMWQTFDEHDDLWKQFSGEKVVVYIGHAYSTGGVTMQIRYL